jgi:aconitate hydratase
VLTVTQMLRKHGVVEKFVEFYGPGLDHLTLADRATIANMAPEYGATIGFFPIDEQTLDYLRDRAATSRSRHRGVRKLQGLWRDDSFDITYTATFGLDLATVQPSLAGPKRPQDRVPAQRHEGLVTWGLSRRTFGASHAQVGDQAVDYKGRRSS